MPGSREPSLPKTSSPKQLAKRTGAGIAVIDLDGTLAPFRLDPAAVRLSRGALRALARLAARRPVVIVSGRPLAFLQQAAEGIPLVLIGSHGAESTLRELAAKLPKPASPALERELREAESSGFLVERKPYGRAVHFRALAEEQRKRVTERWASRLEAVLPAGFAMLHGNAVLEIRPTAMNKGAPLPKLRTLFNQPIAVALGDDTTDEDMFAALGRDELGVLVGARRRSLAAYHLPGVTAVREYLTALALT